MLSNKKSILLGLFTFWCVNIVAMADSVKVPIERQMKHDKINQEQKLLDKADGRLDGIIKATQQDDVNLVKKMNKCLQ